MKDNSQTQAGHRQRMIALARRINEQAGIPLNSNATAEQTQQMLLDAGIVPEDNIASREIVRMREEKFAHYTATQDSAK